VHVADIAAAVLAAVKRDVARTYNVSDDEPAPQSDVVAHACRLLGRPAPALVPWEEAAPKMSAMARSFYAENRRVRNDRMKRELGVRLLYPTYREGLAAIAALNTA
jgi:nucleoside-diphosphate-sugar epimerase